MQFTSLARRLAGPQCTCPKCGSRVDIPTDPPLFDARPEAESNTVLAHYQELNLMTRCLQCLLIVSTILFSWLAMMVVHEFGHVLHGWLSGARGIHVYLHPLDFSRTTFSDNPHRLFEVWGGPIWGSVLPLGLLALVRLTRRRLWYLFAFFAGFCLIANGAYIGAGAFIGAGDAGELLALGSPHWLLLLFGLPAAAAGLCLWHGLGPHFGLGTGRGKVDKKAAVGVTTAALVLTLIEILFI
jgi:hypothetical protein